ncbi:MAG TPA: hypothetical protein DEG47_10870, partial [Cyanobacteria bacterium UBA11148]|nr:hypothetical protein [Cyanobacteria bacterium UBA11148]
LQGTSLQGTFLQQRRWDEILFGECASRILVSVTLEQQDEWESYLNAQLGEPLQTWQYLGRVQSQNVGLRLLIADNLPLIQVTIPAMCDRYSYSI